MSQEAVATLVDRWTNEPGFKDEFRKDPHATIVSHGIELSPEEEDLVKRMDWSGTDEELASRISKSNTRGFLKNFLALFNLHY